MGINALVIGAGKFGQVYARILSSLQQDEVGIPIESIVVTRTSDKSAEEQAKKLQADSPVKIIGEKVSDLHDLIGVLEMYSPSFTAVVAKDPGIKDGIHPVYAAYSLRYSGGVVLCEKPFCNATGNGASLMCFDLFDTSQQPRFGLELPYAATFNQMENSELRQRLYESKLLRFAWFAAGSGDDCLDNLVLHPWSLIPEEFDFIDVKVQDNGYKAAINLYYSCQGKHKKVEIYLGFGRNFAGIEIDGHTVGIIRKGAANTFVDTNLNLEEAMTHDNLFNWPYLLTLENPVKQHILAILKHDPIVGFERTYKSQEFLEQLHGFKPRK